MSLLQRRQVSGDRRKTELLIQSEKIHRALFDSVSHGLKTPIAVIRAALGALPAW